MGCYACDLANGEELLRGGLIHATGGWRVEHCTGPLPVGTLIVKPVRHVLSVAEIDDAEATALGPLLKRAAKVVRDLATADQVYVCLWSHAGWGAGHIHFVVQPAWNRDRERFANPGPSLQVDLFRAGVAPDTEAVEAFANRAREAFAAR